MLDWAVSAVHRFLGSGDRAAEGLDDRLVSQTNAKDRLSGFELLNHIQANAGLIGIAQGPGESTMASGSRARICSMEIESLRTTFVYAQPSLPKVPGEVVDEGVVVVDDQDHIKECSVFRSKCSRAFANNNPNT